MEEFRRLNDIMTQKPEPPPAPPPVPVPDDHSDNELEPTGRRLGTDAGGFSRKIGEEGNTGQQLEPPAAAKAPPYLCPIPERQLPALTTTPPVTVG